MKNFLLCAFIVIVAADVSVRAIPIAPCPSESKPQPICADAELARLNNAIVARFDRLISNADSLTTLLLKRDQRWFQRIIDGGDPANLGVKFESEADPDRVRVLDIMKTRAALLDRLDVSLRPSGIIGEWGNALGTAKVERISNDAVRVVIAQDLAYLGVEDRIRCKIDVNARLQGDGWFSATIEPPARDVLEEIRLRLQGRTLRVVLTDTNGFADTRCQSDGRGNAIAVTGSFFPLTTEPARPENGTAQQPVAPSLDCAHAKNADEEEICADPDLAVLDTKLAQTYRDALRRLETKLASRLREDERSWAKESPGFYEQKLNPYYDKLIAAVHHTSDARDELRVRLEQRVAMIANLDERRWGFEGLWVSHNAVLEIKREAGQPLGTLRVSGVKDEVGGDWKKHCDFDVSGRIDKAKLRVDNDSPLLVRDGSTLVIEEQRGYCTRDLSSGARLFPVKAGLMLPGYPFGRLLRPP